MPLSRSPEADVSGGGVAYCRAARSRQHRDLRHGLDRFAIEFLTFLDAGADDDCGRFYGA